MTNFQPVRVTRPPQGVAPIPLVFDSPHSGQHYPVDFGFSCDKAQLRMAEDTDIDDLYDFTPALGATLVCAEFPRSYLDPNRRVEDIDTSLIDGHWPHPVYPSLKTKSGIGLIWRSLSDTLPIYSRKLSVEELTERIVLCHTPYWAAVTSAIDAAHAQHGRVLHINCHSMPAVAGPGSWVTAGTRFNDIVLGDRDGSTCSPAYTTLLAEAFRAEGLTVAINDPYKGVELVKRFGRPAENRHSIQVEINRELYMVEPTRERTASYATLKAALNRVVGKVAQYATL